MCTSFPKIPIHRLPANPLNPFYRWVFPSNLVVASCFPSANWIGNRGHFLKLGFKPCTNTRDPCRLAERARRVSVCRSRATRSGRQHIYSKISWRLQEQRVPSLRVHSIDLRWECRLRSWRITGECASNRQTQALWALESIHTPFACWEHQKSGWVICRSDTL